MHTDHFAAGILFPSQLGLNTPIDSGTPQQSPSLPLERVAMKNRKSHSNNWFSSKLKINWITISIMNQLVLISIIISG